MVRELDRYEQFGVNLSFKPHIDMDPDVLKHELERHIANETIVKRVTAMKLVIQFGVIGLEWLATKFNFLNLKGWSAFVGIQLNSGKYDSLMEQTYRTIWKRGAPNPWFSLAALILASAAAFHFKIVTLDGANMVAATGAPPVSAPAPNPAGPALSSGISAILGSMGGLFGGGGAGGSGGGGGGLMGMFNAFVDSNKPARGAPEVSSNPPGPIPPSAAPPAPPPPERPSSDGDPVPGRRRRVMAPV